MEFEWDEFKNVANRNKHHIGFDEARHRKVKRRGDCIMSISKKRLKEIASISDSDIDTSDIPELDEEFWKNAKVVIPDSKKAISLRVDREVLEWFKKQGKGYQSLMNAVLLSYTKVHRK